VRIAGIEPGFDKIKPGDHVIVNGTLGDHGMTIMSQREGIKFQSTLKSDCAALNGITSVLWDQAKGIRFMRDATRGGLAAVLNEIAASSNLSIELQETAIPINPTVQAAADMLGLDVLNIANEGKFVVIVDPAQSQKVLELMRSHELGENAALIGTVKANGEPALVEIVTGIGGRRIVQMPYGRELPRIC
jgi:hydrogenase expression/formation protein HypE